MPIKKLPLRQPLARWCQSHWLLILSLVIGLIFRFWQLPNNLFFGSEQGRDATIVQNIIHLKEFTLIGPKTDLDGIFHGAWYYYLLTIPYAVGQGNPLVASGFLICLHLLVIIVGYYWIKELTQNPRLAGLTAVLLATSYELILYSRWLSNAAVAVPLLAFSLWRLWKYQRDHRWPDFAWFLSSFLLASQFEIILLLHLVWLLFLLFGTRLIRWPQWRAWAYSAGVGLILFAPLFLFNLRHEWISLSILRHHTSETSIIADLKAWPGNLLTYAKRNALISQRADWQILPQSAAVYGMIVLLGLALVVGIRQPKLRMTLILLGVWLLAALPIIIFYNVTSLYQLYIQAGFAWTMLLALTIIGFWQWPRWRWVAIALLVVVGLGLPITYQQLSSNQNVFFKTIQDDLNYADQRRLLAWLKADAGTQPYRFNAFTIPYFQSQGWLYLQQYFNPEQEQGNAKIIYIVIESKVEPYWRKTWIAELGNTRLLTEQKFGELLVQKYALP